MTSKELVRVILKAGYIEVRQKGSHKTFQHPFRLSPITVPMHGKDVKRPILLRILRDIGFLS